MTRGVQTFSFLGLNSHFLNYAVVIVEAKIFKNYQKTIIFKAHFETVGVHYYTATLILHTLAHPIFINNID